MGAAGEARGEAPLPLLGLEYLEQLASLSPPRYLNPSPEISRLARDASKVLFDSLLPFCPKPLPVDHLLADESFDAEQIWHQIDLQSQPLTRSLRRELKKFEKIGPEERREIFGGKAEEKEVGKEGLDGSEKSDDEQEEEEEEEENAGDEDDEDEEGEGTEAEEEEGEEEHDGHAKGGGRLEDGFFDTKELEAFIEKEEEREYVGKDKDNTDDEEDDDDQFGGFDDDESDDEAANARFEDFYVKNKKASSAKSKVKNKKIEFLNDPEEISDRQGESDASQDSETDDKQKKDNDTLSMFEKERMKNQSMIDQIEKELVAPKSWTMLGEVTASKRPKNSALEIDLDFQHNKGRPPVSTEENTASIEELIIKRIREGQLDEVQRPATLPSRAPKELKELDENKSQKGLAEIYEADYAQQTGLAHAPLSSSDEQKKEATALFKRLCLKLDALSHFHFTPKPIIEDLSIEVNVPALAVEEIAPLAVSDAAMLAPEEIFSGKGDIKEEAELTQEERRRRRATKKRKFKSEAEKKAAKKARENAQSKLSNGKEDS